MTLITTKTAANLLNVSVRAVELQVKRGIYKYEYIAGPGRGGRQLRIALESLPQAAQDRYHGIKKERKEEELSKFSNDQLHEANEKKGCVLEYWRSGLSPEDFVARRNADGYYSPITVGQLYAWQRIIKNGGDLAELVDQRGGRQRRGKTSIPEDAWEYFYSLYMTQQERTVTWCYRQTKIFFPDIPSEKTFQRRVKTIPPYALLYYRKGETAFRDALPSMVRSRSDIESNDIWFSDHHLFDVFVRNSKGKVCRPWLTAFFDARSNMLVGALIREEYPNSTAVKQCFRIAAEQYGLPNEVYFDNGKDYRSASFNQEYPQSLVRQLGIGSIYATAYHGQAKTVERFFGTMERQFGRMWNTYAGSDAKKRPECMRTSNKKIAEIAPSMEEFVTAFFLWVQEYHNTPSRGNDMHGQTPQQVYNANLSCRRVVGDLDALRLLCGNTVQRTVRKNGIELLNNFYYNDKLLAHVGQKVTALYDPENIDVVAVFDAENNAICWAKAKLVSPFRHTTESDYREAAKQKKVAWAQVRAAQPVVSHSIQELITKKQLEEIGMEPPNVTEQVKVTPQTSRNVEVLNAERALKDDGPSISEILMNSYMKKGG